VLPLEGGAAEAGPGGITSDGSAAADADAASDATGAAEAAGGSDTGSADSAEDTGDTGSSDDAEAGVDAGATSDEGGGSEAGGASVAAAYSCTATAASCPSGASILACVNYQNCGPNEACCRNVTVSGFLAQCEPAPCLSGVALCLQTKDCPSGQTCAPAVSGPVTYGTCVVTDAGASDGGDGGARRADAGDSGEGG
jgi:hypothetical protein